MVFRDHGSQRGLKAQLERRSNHVCWEGKDRSADRRGTTGNDRRRNTRNKLVLIEESDFRNRDELNRNKIGNDRSIGTTRGQQLDQTLMIIWQIVIVVMIGIPSVAMRMV